LEVSVMFGLMKVRKPEVMLGLKRVGAPGMTHWFVRQSHVLLTLYTGALGIAFQISSILN
jgi:hypothetical protein